MDNQPVSDNWAWHGLTRDTGTLTLASDKAVEIAVEHFQIDGCAVLDFFLVRQPATSPPIGHSFFLL